MSKTGYGANWAIYCDACGTRRDMQDRESDIRWRELHGYLKDDDYLDVQRRDFCCWACLKKYATLREMSGHP